MEAAPSLGRSLGLSGLWIKRDDQTHGLVGGNKVRKLEFLLAQALERDAKVLVTSGGSGSNHAVATAYFGRIHGLLTLALLGPQPENSATQSYRMAHQALGTTVVSPRKLRNGGLSPILAALRLGISRRSLHYIPPGGSSPVGNLGYVAAALELAEQWDAMNEQAPHAIVVAGGSLGTAVGLAVGCGLHSRLAQTQVIAVAAIPWPLATQRRLQTMVRRQVACVRRHLGRAVDPVPVRLVHGYVGRGYGYPTVQGQHAAERFAQEADLELDAVYTAKAASGLLALSRTHLLGQRVVFWNTKHHWPDIVGSAHDVASRNATGP